MIYRYNKYIIILLGVLLSSQVQAYEKVGVTSFQFLKIVPDARSTAMGEAYSSVANGADGLSWNPAAMMRTSGLSINLSRVDYIFDTYHFGASVSYCFHRFAFGLTYMGVDYGSIDVTEVSLADFNDDGVYMPGFTGEVIQPGATVAGFGIAHRLTNKFTYGIDMKYVREDMIVASESLVMFDMGILYETGFRSIVIAATMRNFGPQVEYFDYSYPLPQTMNIGISTDVIGNNNPLLKESNNHKLIVAFDLIQPRDYDQQYNVGLEYSFMNVLALRTGYKINYDTEGFTCGAGINLKGLSVDYSINSYGKYLEPVHRFTFSIKR